MDEDPAGGVRRKKDSSLVRAAELVRDGQASAMVSAGNTGATMAAALLRMGRLPGVVRPCIATPLPRLGRTPAVLVDTGANTECTPAMLVQDAHHQCRPAANRVRAGRRRPCRRICEFAFSNARSVFGEKMADVRQAGGAEQGVADRVGQGVGVRMALEAVVRAKRHAARTSRRLREIGWMWWPVADAEVHVGRKGARDSARGVSRNSR